MSPSAYYPNRGCRVTKTISATVGNVLGSLSPGTDKRWLLSRGVITLTTNATVANRKIKNYLTDGTNITEYLGSTTAVTASSTRNLSFGEIVYLSTATIYGAVEYYGLARAILLEGSDEFKVEIENGVAGDSYSGYVVVEESLWR